MDIEFKTIDVKHDFHTCYENRKDAYICSFGSDSGFEKSIEGYEERVMSRLDDERWFYIHIWERNRIVGQLEFKSFSQLDSYGYIHLIYLIQELRGSGAADIAYKYIVSKLLHHGCKGAVLSVSRINKRAIDFYISMGLKYLSNNPKHELTDFYYAKFCT